MSAPLQLMFNQVANHTKLRQRSNRSTFLSVPLIGFTTLLLSACSGEDITPLHQTNPAADYCIKLNGSLETIKHINGDVSLCTLPDGEVVDSWELFRRDHQKS
ncbi:putative hemolysin [Shewanella donghaensis]|uniref:putative hemolysin n=1 Tax=Shewanella donghaensis TaxID=238836 RepID=UPI001D03A671|nr:DUF333 domain-containing protein [Shewanella donghaensis]